MMPPPEQQVIAVHGGNGLEAEAGDGVVLERTRAAGSVRESRQNSGNAARGWRRAPTPGHFAPTGSTRNGLRNGAAGATHNGVVGSIAPNPR